MDLDVVPRQHKLDFVKLWNKTGVLRYTATVRYASVSRASIIVDKKSLVGRTKKSKS